MIYNPIQFDVIKYLIKFNINWYKENMRDLLMRYKILALFFVLALAPSIKNIISLLSIFVNNLLAINPVSIKQYATILIGFQILSIIWSVLQKKIIFDQPWNKYIYSLKITKLENMIIKSVLLLVFNTIILVPIIFTLVNFIISSNQDLQIKILYCMRAFFIINTLLLLQYVYLNKYYHYLIYICFADIIFITTISKSLPIQYLSLICCIFFVATLYILIFTKNNQNLIDKSTRLDRNQKVSRFSNLFFTFAMMQARNIFINSSELSVTVLMLVLNFSAVLIFMKFGVNSIRIFVLSSCMLINALIVSNLFKRLSYYRIIYSSALLYLPIRKYEMYLIDFSIVALITAFINFLTYFICLFFFSISGFSMIITCLTFSVIFLIFSYFAQIKLANYGLFLSFLLMVFFNYIQYQIIK